MTLIVRVYWALVVVMRGGAAEASCRNCLQTIIRTAPVLRFPRD